MAGMAVPTVKIVESRAKNGFIIINLSDFIIGVHTLWDPEKNQEKIVVKSLPKKELAAEAKAKPVEPEAAPAEEKPKSSASPSPEAKDDSWEFVEKLEIDPVEKEEKSISKNKTIKRGRPARKK